MGGKPVEPKSFEIPPGEYVLVSRNELARLRKTQAVADALGIGPSFELSLKNVVRHYRVLAGLTIKELSKEAKVDRKQLGLIESGENLSPSEKTIEKLGVYFGKNFEKAVVLLRELNLLRAA